jgi:hypothetical protein
MRYVLSMVLFGSLLGGGIGCIGMEEQSGQSSDELGKQAGTPMLNLSHIACTDDGQVLAHFVLLFYGSSQPPTLSGTYDNDADSSTAPAAFGPVAATKSSGNVWHYNVMLPSGDIDILSATVGSTTLHNPGDYAGDYQCGPEVPVCSVEVLPNDLLCLDSPLGPPKAECGSLGLLVLGKDDNLTGLTFTSTKDAYVAIVKSGSGVNGGCVAGQASYRIYTNVSVGDTLLTPADQNISHVTYCACPDE